MDLALLAYLLLRQTEDHFINDSQLTLAQRLGCERRTIADSIKRLSELGWIVNKPSYQWNEKTQRKTRSIGKTAGLAINLEKLPKPVDKAKHASPSRDAVNLAARHTEFLKREGSNIRQKNFGRQQEHAAQRLIESMGGDFEKAVALVNFAIHDQRFRRTARKSLYEIRTRLQAIKLAQDAADCAVAVSVSIPSMYENRTWCHVRKSAAVDTTI